MGMEKLGKLNFSGLGNHVYKVLKDAIVDLRLKPGEYLNITSISQQLGTSNTPVRSALERLTSEGLVVSKPRIGFFVSKIDEEQVRHLFAIREALEILALENGIHNIKSEDVSKLILDLKQALSDPETLASSPPYEIDYQLHGLIISSYPNPYLHRIFDQIVPLLKRARNIIKTYLPSSKNRWKEWVVEEAQQHLEIAERIFMKNLEEAKRALRVHLRASREIICELLSDSLEEIRNNEGGIQHGQNRDNDEQSR